MSICAGQVKHEAPLGCEDSEGLRMTTFLEEEAVLTAGEEGGAAESGDGRQEGRDGGGVW